MSGPPSEEMSGTSENTDGASAENSIDAPQGKGPNGGMGAGGFIQAEPSNQLSVTWTQVGDIKGVDGTVFAAAGASNTTDYNNNVNLFVDNFEQMTFTSEDGTSIMYNLYLPEGYEENTAYPLVLFMPDATGEGSDQYLTLTESLGPIVWTTEESQADNPCIVLAPQYESTNSSDPAYTMELLHSIIEQYSVDINRLYLVGQSSGTIRSIKLMIENPDTFAGAMLVAGQAETEYVDRISELANQNIWMICSAGDERAYPGMTAIV
jgi:predicted peptidase